jgi:hypothetical protein
MKRNGIDRLLFTIWFILTLTSNTTFGASEVTASRGAVAEFEGDIAFNRPIPVRLQAKAPDEQGLAEIPWVRLETNQSFGWGMKSRLNWSLAQNTAWKITVELLDQEGRVLKHPSDVPTYVWTHAAVPPEPGMAQAELDLGALHYQGRRADFRSIRSVPVPFGLLPGTEVGHSK